MERELISKRQRSMNETTNLIHLPDEILDHILCRLPVKSICTCKCICKNIHSIITKPDFHSKTDSEFLLVIDKSHTPSISLYLVDEYDHNQTVKTFYAESSNCYYNINFIVSNSCNGFVIIAIGNLFYQFNPLVRVFVRVLTLDCSPMSNNIAVVGICYDASIDDYKVVVQYKNYLGRKFVAVASLKTKRWTQIDFHFDIKSIKTGPIVNGRMHWTVDDKSKFRSRKIIYFDASENLFKELPSPKPDLWGRVENLILGVLGGCLCMAEDSCFRTVPLMIMKEYGVGESWTPLTLIPCFQHLLFRKNGEILHEILGIYHVYNPLEEKTTRKLPSLNHKNLSNAVLIGHSFASPVGYELDDNSRYFMLPYF